MGVLLFHVFCSMNSYRSTEFDRLFQSLFSIIGSLFAFSSDTPLLWPPSSAWRRTLRKEKSGFEDTTILFITSPLPKPTLVGVTLKNGKTNIQRSLFIYYLFHISVFLPVLGWALTFNMTGAKIQHMIVVLTSSLLIPIILLTSSAHLVTAPSSSLSAVAFLTARPSLETIYFAQQLTGDISFIDVYVIIDDNNVSFSQWKSARLRFLQFNETVCNEFGFRRSNLAGIRRACSAWDKAIYFFARVSLQYRFVWFVEDDVFIPSTQAFLSLHHLYSSNNDLIAADIQYGPDGNLHGWFHTHLIANEFTLPWCNGIVSGVGLSRRLLSAADEYVRWRGHLPFIEFLFHILVVQDGQMKVVIPPELATIVYRTTYSFEKVLAAPNNWWHPVKLADQRFQWRHQWVHLVLFNKPHSRFFRSRLANNLSLSHNYTSTPLQSIEIQLSRTEATLSIAERKERMISLLAQFEIEKSRLSISTRRQLRHRFLRLQSNQSQELTKTAVRLANSAYKLPESNWSLLPPARWYRSSFLIDRCDK